MTKDTLTPGLWINIHFDGIQICRFKIGNRFRCHRCRPSSSMSSYPLITFPSGRATILKLRSEARLALSRSRMSQNKNISKMKKKILTGLTIEQLHPEDKNSESGNILGHAC